MIFIKIGTIYYPALSKAKRLLTGQPPVCFAGIIKKSSLQMACMISDKGKPRHARGFYNE